MKKISLLLFFTTISFLMNAQEWSTDYIEAKEIASNENKKIILVFQGSDWCAPCIKLDREIWSTEEFESYAKEHFIMVQVDFPKKKKNMLPKEQMVKNAALAEKYNKNGVFPLVVVIDNKNRVLGQASYKKTTPKEYIAMLESFKL